MTTTSPIDIATPSRNASSSPSSQGKQTADNHHALEDSRTSAIMSGAGFDAMSLSRGRQDSFAGAKPISMNNPNRNLDSRPRRESLANSLVQGMSWGGISVGSWVRDDIMMTGTSPFPYQSPSYHSSSYLPKLEANFMRDFSCCGMTLASLHDLLQHYEEQHAQQTPQSVRNASAAQLARQQSQQPNSKAALAAQAANSVQQQAQNQQRQQGSMATGSGSNLAQGGGKSSLTGGIQAMRQQQQAQQQSQPTTPTQSTVQPAVDMDAVEDMEMDDAVGPMDTTNTSTSNAQQQPAQQSMFGQQQRPNLSLNSSGLQGLRTSQPSTPAVGGFGFQNNPTVSSVNTPTLSAQPLHQQGTTFSPDTSYPGTPAELDEDFNAMAMNLNLNNGNLLNNMGAFPYGFGNDLGLDYCIDEPAKRLFSPNGGFGSQRAAQQQFAQLGLGTGQFAGASNEDLMRRLRQQQQLQMGGFGSSSGLMMPGEEHKPFRCPVIGCEKAYKNQNGLKYHKTHGHQSQQLHENGDGTFSIVNPDTLVPYPGTLGMEKEKPYKCDHCGKRYKNLNGLKYHKQHSPPCNPELKLNGHLQGLGGPLGVNVAGLPGIGEDSIM